MVNVRAANRDEAWLQAQIGALAGRVVVLEQTVKAWGLLLGILEKRERKAR